MVYNVTSNVPAGTTVTLDQLHNRAKVISELTNVEHYIDQGNGFPAFVIGDQRKGLVDKIVYYGNTKRELLEAMRAYHDGVRMGMGVMSTWVRESLTAGMGA